MSRIDRFLVRGDWEEFYPHYYQEVNVRTASDHWPVVLHTSIRSYGPKPSRFENMWTTHSNFRVMIKVWWKECDVGGWGGFCFMKKLQFIKKRLVV